MQNRKITENQLSWSLNDKSLCLKFASRELRGDFANKIGCDFAFNSDRLKGFVEYARRINNESLFFKFDPQDNSINFIDATMREKFRVLLALEESTRLCTTSNKLFIIADSLKNATPEAPYFLNYDKTRLDPVEKRKSLGLLQDLFPNESNLDTKIVDDLEKNMRSKLTFTV